MRYSKRCYTKTNDINKGKEMQEFEVKKNTPQNS